MIQLPWITQNPFLMNSETSAFKEKRSYVIGIVSLCSLVSQLIDCGQGGPGVDWGLNGFRDYTPPLFPDISAQSHTGGPAQGEPGTVTWSQPSLMPASSVRPLALGRYLINSFGGVTPLWKLSLFDLKVGLGVRFCLEMLLEDSLLITHRHVRWWCCSKAFSLPLPVSLRLEACAGDE